MSTPTLVDSHGQGLPGDSPKQERSVRQKILFDYIPLPMAVGAVLWAGVNQTRTENNSDEIKRLRDSQAIQQEFRERMIATIGALVTQDKFDAAINRLSDQIDRSGGRK